MPQRHLILPPSGALLVSTDLHGNLEDLLALRAAFEREHDAHWVILGDCVHGPDEQSARDDPALYGYRDQSFAVVRGILEAQAEHPGRVHYVLGNHDHGHLGGHHTRKFHDDEVANLESQLDRRQLAELHGLFRQALLAVAAPCGVLLSHGAPDETLRSLEALDELDPEEMADDRVLAGLLWSYGQPDATAARVLAQISRPGLPLSLMIHGHDRDESGYFTEGARQACPVLFGAPRSAKCYLRLDLTSRYESASALRHGIEVLKLHLD